ncbi:DUF4232 domain-containing protein [Streptomyces poonensis]|uniref:DUF4232 domain-containing protein n=1 Tax=Streptomyces poonensis TaxID=68255 RepID=A0A918P9Z1_9ACTN|nr:DUF4232 domain-containing protein [Streptomyces poonensis]GGY93544.1 hypothetical protein GCM10010365_10230 [Streptomyces poonensis]GLJ87537.1 hypothetical protein GCM10017589_01370 [Streptomyces poonensis]
MMNRRLRAALVATAAVTAGFLMTACDEGTAGAAGAAPVAAADSGTDSGKGGSEPTADSGSASTSGSSTKATEATEVTEVTEAEAGDKSGYGQSCGTNDLSWSAKEMTQAGGYYQVSVKAKPGITCVLPGGLPVIAFGSGGTQAGPAEQVVGEEITLSGGTTVYAGVSPKSTSGDGGTEYSTVIVSVTGDDPNPVSLKVGSVLVDQPLVTNWHTDPQDAVPFTS